MFRVFCFISLCLLTIPFLFIKNIPEDIIASFILSGMLYISLGIFILGILRFEPVWWKCILFWWFAMFFDRPDWIDSNVR